LRLGLSIIELGEDAGRAANLAAFHVPVEQAATAVPTADRLIEV
jgi:hypothetical protein